MKKALIPFAILVCLASLNAPAKEAERPAEIQKLKKVFRIPGSEPRFRRYFLGKNGGRSCLLEVDVSEDVNDGMIKDDPKGTFYNGTMVFNTSVAGDGEMAEHSFSALYYGNRKDAFATKEFKEKNGIITFNSSSLQVAGGGSPEGNAAMGMLGIKPTQFFDNNEISIGMKDGNPSAIKMKSYESGGLAFLRAADKASCGSLRPLTRADMAKDAEWQKNFRDAIKSGSMNRLLEDMDYSLKMEERWLAKHASDAAADSKWEDGTDTAK